MTTLHFSFVDAMSAIGRDEWQELLNSDNPFVSYDYLNLLEQTGATGPESGWQPMHLVGRCPDGRLKAALPLYLKDDSWGEFVFDFAWADAHHRHGVPYYPKLVTAIPYTPVPGPRLLCRNIDQDCGPLTAAVQQRAEELQASSWHVLFPDAAQLDALEHHGMLIRKDCQYHWFNAGYSSFDHFLGTFRSARRKKTRRERRRISEAGVTIESSRGRDLDASQWREFYDLYASTFFKRGRSPYFAEAFFTGLAQRPHIDIVIKWALRDGKRIAAALFFKTTDILYGRYWGCTDFVDGLHFELCYYQGIELCIEHSLKQFDPGVQGEHKIARGFQATSSWSAHWLRHTPFAQAIDTYLKTERQHINAYMREVDGHLPFRRHTPDPGSDDEPEGAP